MKKIIIIMFIIVIIPAVYFTFFMNRPIARIGSRNIYEKDIRIQADIMKTMNSIDRYSDENALYDIIRYSVFIGLCQHYGIDAGKEALKEHERLIEGNSIVSELRTMLGRNFRKYFLIPDYCSNAFTLFALNDTVQMQKERYMHAKNIAEEWMGDEYRDLLNDFSEYVEYSGNIVIDSNSIIEEFHNNIFFDDISYYYILRQNKNNTYGIRVMKYSIEEIMLNNPADYRIEFYKEAYMRAVYKLSEGSFWHSIIFNE